MSFFLGKGPEPQAEILRQGRVPNKAGSPYTRQRRGVRRGLESGAALAHTPPPHQTRRPASAPYSPHPSSSQGRWSPMPAPLLSWCKEIGRTHPQWLEEVEGGVRAHSGGFSPALALPRPVSCLEPPGLSSLTPFQGEAGSLADAASGGMTPLGCNLLGNGKRGP